MVLNLVFHLKLVNNLVFHYYTGVELGILLKYDVEFCASLTK